MALIQSDFAKNKNLIFRELFKSKNIKIPFSYTHIEEIINIPLTDIHEKQEEIETYLKYLAEITKNIYWVYSERNDKINEFNKHPQDTYYSLILSPISDIAIDMFLNIVIDQVKKQYKEELKSFPLNLNTIRPTEIISEIERIGKSTNKTFNFLKIIDECFEFYPLKIPNTYYKSIVMFEILDLFGYHPEKPPSKSYYARLWDAQHTYYASECDFFISDDKRTRYKAEVIYNLLEIKTKIVTSDDAHIILQHQ